MEIRTHKPEPTRESRTCTKRVDVRHINYNDFLPLTAERDLNYRYPAWRAGAGCPDSPFLITGCARAFQESDSRHNSRVMGQSSPLLPPPPATSLLASPSRPCSELIFENLPTNRSPSDSFPSHNQTRTIAYDTCYAVAVCSSDT